MASSKSRTRQNRSSLSVLLPSISFRRRSSAGVAVGGGTIGHSRFEEHLDDAAVGRLNGPASVPSGGRVPRVPRGHSSSGSSGSDSTLEYEKPISRRQSWMSRPLERRKSGLGFLTNMIPSLTSIPSDSAPVPRKPLGPDSAPPPPHASGHNGFDANVQQALFHGFDNESVSPVLPPQLPPLEKHQPLEPPTRSPETQGRKGSIPNMLKKIQKVATLPHMGDHPPAPPQKDGPLPPPIPSVIQTSDSPPTRKKTRDPHRSSSADLLPPNAKLQPSRLQARRLSPSPSPDARGRSSSAQPPRSRHGHADGSRVLSTPGLSIPAAESEESGSAHEARGRLRRSWLPGGQSRSGSADLGKSRNAGAWIMSPGGTAEYSLSTLINGEVVPELWNETGLIYVYLHPKGSGRGPSFKVSDQIFSSSRVLNELLLAEAVSMGQQPREFQGRNSLSAAHAVRRESSPPGGDGLGEGRLYLPLGSTEVERLVAARNLFAFLTGQPLVGTRANPTLFSAFLQISAMLREFDFNSYDGSSFGEPVDSRFESCLDQFNIADVRNSREKTLESLILGERMKSWPLYNESFAHAVGKYEDLIDFKSHLVEEVSPSTRNRLARAHLDLINRQANANSRLESFDFPSIFAGIANSTSTEEYKNLRFKEWKNSFTKMRSFVLGYYKDVFGNWPPKARSKRNNFSQSGLNRMCLKILYSDLCALYDLLVDRESLTTRMIDQSPEDVHEDAIDPMMSALRKMLSEFDNSSPPVLPPIPYDVPKIPTMTAIREDYNHLTAKKQAQFDKGLASHELLLILIKSHNIDTDSLRLPFLAAFKDFELKEAKSVHPNDLADQRIGYWLFLYVVIQSLPMLTVDAPGLHFTDGVEYFLCEPPQGNLPWMEDAGEVRKMWYQTAGQGIVELSADVVMFSIEATYMRSHCWLAAKEWESIASQAGGSAGTASPAHAQIGGSQVPTGLEPLQPPRAVFQDMDPYASPSPHGSGGPGSAQGSPQLMPIRQRNGSPGGRPSAMAEQLHRSSIVMGLEPLSLSQGVSVGERRVVSSRPGSSAGLPPQAAGLRSRSVSNLRQLSAHSSSTDPLPPPPSKINHVSRDSVGGPSTFDDILKGMEDTEKTKPKKRFGF